MIFQFDHNHIHPGVADILRQVCGGGSVLGLACLADPRSVERPPLRSQQACSTWQCSVSRPQNRRRPLLNHLNHLRRGPIRPANVLAFMGQPNPFKRVELSGWPSAASLLFPRHGKSNIWYHLHDNSTLAPSDARVCKDRVEAAKICRDEFQVAGFGHRNTNLKFECLERHGILVVGQTSAQRL